MKRLILLTILFIMTFVTTACSDSYTQKHSAVNDEEEKDTLRIGLDDEPPTLDPHLSSSAVDRQVMHAVFDKLVDIDEDMEIVPKLAKDWDVSDDHKTYTFYLEEDVEFHDGTPFDADAVKFNFERMLDPEVGSARIDEVEEIEKVNVVDDYTVEVVLKDPHAPLLGALTDRAGMMVSPSAVEEMGGDFENHPVGTGPYEFIEKEKNNYIGVSRYEDYWDDEAKIENVIYEPYTDENIRTTNLTSGDIDLVSLVSPKDANKLEEDPSITVDSRDGNGYLGLHISKENEALGDENIREAIDYAVDREAIAKVAYEGGALPAIDAFPPENWAHNPDIEVPENGVEEAKKLVKESGVEDPSFTLNVPPSETDEDVGQMVQNMLAEVGITVSVEVQEHGQLLDSMESGNFDAIYLGWDGRVDPDESVSKFFMSDGYNNYDKIDDEELDSLLKEARTTLDEDKRATLYEEFSEKLFNLHEHVFLVHPDEIKAMKKNVEGFVHYPDGMVRPHELDFE